MEVASNLGYRFGRLDTEVSWTTEIPPRPSDWASVAVNGCFFKKGIYRFSLDYVTSNLQKVPLVFVEEGLGTKTTALPHKWLFYNGSINWEKVRLYNIFDCGYAVVEYKTIAYSRQNNIYRTRLKFVETLCSTFVLPQN
ncbi:MAG: hypothetical protein LBU65_15445 [Planctomycetaceae bacterium]|nr:hypothetical protein [Planctomycetaceae bacterium]